MRSSITWMRKRPEFCTESARDARKRLRGRSGEACILQGDKTAIFEKKPGPQGTRVEPQKGFFLFVLFVDDADHPDLRVLRSLDRESHPHVFPDIVDVGLGDSLSREKNRNAG